MNALAIAVQGLGFGFAQIALQGLLTFVAIEVDKNDQAGGGATRRARRRAMPSWAPVLPTDDDESLMLVGIL